MGNIVRVITSKLVYSIGNHMPVPDGFEIEPFIISQIQWDQEAGFIEFVCTPDMDAATKSPEFEDDMTEAQRQILTDYHSRASQAAQDSLLLTSIIPFSDDCRIETLMSQQEFYEAQQEAQQEEEQEAQQEEVKHETPVVAKPVEPAESVDSITSPDLTSFLSVDPPPNPS